MKLEARLSHSKIRFNQDTDAHLVLSLTAPTPDAEVSRPKLALVMCIDVSGSMAGQKLEYAKRSALKMIDHLKPDDVFGVVTFGSNVDVIAKPSKLSTEKRDEIRAAVQKLGTNGMTNFSGGMLKSIDLLKELDLGNNYIHRVIMLTDGQANVGPAKDDEGIIKLLTANMDHVTVSAFGYGAGSGFSPDFLASFAREGKGNFAHVENPDTALKAFGSELGGLISTYATDILVEVKPLNGHGIEKVVSDVDVDEENTGEVHIKVPDLLAEETRHLVLAVKLAQQKTHGPRAVNVFEATVKYQTFDSTGKKHTHTVESKCKVQFVKEGDEEQKPNEALDDIVGLAELVRAQLEAEEQAKVGNFAAAQAVMSAQGDSFRRRGRARLAVATNNISSRLGSASLYEANSTYLRSFERGITRGVGGTYGVDVSSDLGDLGVQLSTSSQTVTSDSFQASDPANVIVAPVDPGLNPPDLSGLMIQNPALDAGALTITTTTIDPGALTPALGNWTLGHMSTSAPSLTIGHCAPVPTHESAEDDKAKKAKSSKKSLKQSRSKTNW